MCVCVCACPGVLFVQSVQYVGVNVLTPKCLHRGTTITANRTYLTTQAHIIYILLHPPNTEINISAVPRLCVTYNLGSSAIYKLKRVSSRGGGASLEGQERQQAVRFGLELERNGGFESVVVAPPDRHVFHVCTE